MQIKFMALYFVFSLSCYAQQVETIADTLLLMPRTATYKFSYRQLVIPSILIGYGIIGLKNDQIIDFNTQIRQEVQEDIDEKLSIDDFSQYAPAASVYLLNGLGVKGKHNLKDQTVIIASSYIIMSGTVFSLKSLTHQQRPDKSSFKSFPSGHTATAFAGAEFLWQEYKDISIAYGIAGYAVATGTGLFRIYNNRHWLTDVAAGAGIGILSTKLAYWLQPYIKNKIFGNNKIKYSTTVMPFYSREQAGVGIAIKF